MTRWAVSLSEAQCRSSRQPQAHRPEQLMLVSLVAEDISFYEPLLTAAAAAGVRLVAGFPSTASAVAVVQGKIDAPRPRAHGVS